MIRLEDLKPRPSLQVWLGHHGHSAVLSVRRLCRRPWATMLTVTVMAVALVLPLGLSVALQNLRTLAGSVQRSRDMNVFLKNQVSVNDGRRLAARLRQRQDIAQVDVRTPEQGLADLRQSIPVDNVITALGQNPLPTMLIVTPVDTVDDGQLAADLKTYSETEFVQQNVVWRRRLQSWSDLGSHVVQALSILFGLAAVLVVGNTVRLDIQSHQEEIIILQLLGASKGFICRPFLYLGAWYGLGAGLIALGLLATIGFFLQDSIREVATSYHSHFALRGLSWLQSLSMLVVALMLGWLGGWLVAGHFLRQARDTK